MTDTDILCVYLIIGLVLCLYVCREDRKGAIPIEPITIGDLVMIAVLWPVGLCFHISDIEVNKRKR